MALGSAAHARGLAGEGAVPPPSTVADPDPDSDSAVSGDIGLSLLSTTGNTSQQSTRARLRIRLEYPEWRHRAEVIGYRAEDDDETTADRRAGSLQSGYRISERSYLFARISVERDRFGAFERRDSGTFGIGRSFLRTPTVLLELEAGIGRRALREQDADDSRYETVGQFHGVYGWRFTEASRLEQDIRVETGPDNTYTESETSLRSRFAENLFWRASYTVQHNSDVPEDRESTDTLTSITLEYDF